MPKVTLSNPRKKGRFVSVDGGSVHIPAGESRDMELTDEQIEAEKKAGLTVESKSEPEPETGEGDRFDDMSEEELRDYIETETGDKPHWKASPDTLREKARAI